MITYLHTFDDLSAADCKKQRQLILSEKVDAYFAWAKQKYSQVTHNSTIGKALAYSINQEDYLRVFLSDGHVPMDNNYAEQAIRPFTIGRKNVNGRIRVPWQIADRFCGLFIFRWLFAAF